MEEIIINEELNKVKITLDPATDYRCREFSIFYKGEEVLGLVTFMELVVDDRVDKEPTGEFKKDFELELTKKLNTGEKNESKNTRKESNK